MGRHNLGLTPHLGENKPTPSSGRVCVVYVGHSLTQFVCCLLHLPQDPSYLLLSLDWPHLALWAAGGGRAGEPIMASVMGTLIRAGSIEAGTSRSPWTSPCLLWVGLELALAPSNAPSLDSTFGCNCSQFLSFSRACPCHLQCAVHSAALCCPHFSPS